MYKNRKNKNVVTVKNTIINLTSRNTSKQFQKKYQFNTILERYLTPEERETRNNLKSRVIYELTNGDHTKANSYARFKFLNVPEDDEGKQIYGFDQIVSSIRRPAINKVKEVLAFKKSMKIRFRVKFIVVNHGEEKDVVFLYQKEPTIVNVSNKKKNGIPGDSIIT